MGKLTERKSPSLCFKYPGGSRACAAGGWPPGVFAAGRYRNSLSTIGAISAVRIAFSPMPMPAKAPAVGFT